MRAALKAIVYLDLAKKWHLNDIGGYEYFMLAVTVSTLIFAPGWTKSFAAPGFVLALFMCKLCMDLGAIQREIKELDIKLHVERMLQELGITVLPAEQFDKLMEDD